MGAITSRGLDEIVRDRASFFRANPLREAVEAKLGKLVYGRLYAAFGFDPPWDAQRLLGCPIGELREWLELFFEDGMNWGNHGTKWQIDHTRPLASFDLSDPHEAKLACHYTNLMPMWKADNARKNSYYRGKRHFHRKYQRSVPKGTSYKSLRPASEGPTKGRLLADSGNSMPYLPYYGRGSR